MSGWLSLIEDEFREKYPDCNTDYPQMIGDGKCLGLKMDKEECGWDGGDCIGEYDLITNDFDQISLIF